MIEFVLLTLQVNKHIDMIRDWFTKNKDEETKQLLYVLLSPTDNAKDCDVYLDALSWALANKKQI